MGGGGAISDGQGQPLHNGSLSHAWFPDEGGVVLGPPGQDLDHPGQFLFPADHRVQLSVGSHPGQVPGALVQQAGIGAALRFPGSDGAGGEFLAPQKGCQSLGELVQIRPLLRHKAAGGALTVLEQTQQQVLRADSVLPQAAGGGRCLLDGQAALGGQALVEGPSGHAGAHQLGDGGAQGAAVHPAALKGPGGGAVLLAGQTQQQVLAAHIAVPKPGGVLLGQPQGAQGGGGKAAFWHTYHLWIGFPLSISNFKKIIIAFFKTCDKMRLDFYGGVSHGLQD